MNTLIIVESPTKAKTIGRFLGRNYTVKSSFGHIRDLPKTKIGVDTAHDFAPDYTISKDKKKTVDELKTAAKKADHILFATDSDREGEAISWHLAHVLDIDPKKAERIVFHEITKEAILDALKHPRLIDNNLVDAQQARRIVDRLVGYELSPFLWRKVAKGLSAGRVQSVAVRLVVEREEEIKKFIPETYFTLDGDFSTTTAELIQARLFSIAGKKLDKLAIKTNDEVNTIIAQLKKAEYRVTANERKKTNRAPLPPFTTSTLQQEANHRLGFSAKQTMRLAQQLYEGVELGASGSVGLITYMRTDSFNLSEKFLTEARALIGTDYGADYQLAEPRIFKTKSKNAQEAHEAIRPTEANRTPDEVKNFLDKNQFRLYDLIWRRGMASQMTNAVLDSTTIDITSSTKHLFRATGQTVVFDGFLRLYPDRTKENLLPKVILNEELQCSKLTPEEHATEPPARYSDATLVKALEEYGIGRPSTFAPTIATVEDRGYVERDEKKKLRPTSIAEVVNHLLVEHFPNIVDFAFTAAMEEQLDAIARGEEPWTPVVSAFYLPFKKQLTLKDKELNKKDLTEEKSEEKCDKCGQPMVIKIGRFGKFLACSGYPDCRNTKQLDKGGKNAAPAVPTNINCTTCGAPMVQKVGRFGPFLSCSTYPKCKEIKNIEQKTGVTCPECKQGDVVERKSKRGRIFYSCNQYPKCTFALWSKPNGELCPTCNNLLVFGAKGTIRCSHEGCTFTKQIEETVTPITPYESTDSDSSGSDNN